MSQIVFVSHTADRTTFKVGSHHYARELAALGHDVLHMSTPYSRLAGLGRKDERRELAAQGPFTDHWGVTHLVPTRWLPARVSHRHLDLRREIARLGYGHPAWVVVDQPLMHRALDWFEPGSQFCYRPTDLYESGAYAKGQQRLVASVDAVVATSPDVVRSLGLPSSMPTRVIENGVDLSIFGSAVRPEAVRRGAVYVGAMDHRFDWSALASMAAAWWQETGEETMVIGPAPRDLPALPSSLRLVGAMPYEEVPAVLAAARVGLLPFTATALNRGRSPMKLYEYLAAGLAVVGPSFVFRNLPAGQAPTYGYEDAAGIASAMREATTEQPVDPALIRDHDWSTKAEQLLDFLEGV